MKIVSNVKVESATGRFMVDMRCSYWFGGLNCSPCLIPYEDLEVIIGELRYAQLWLKRRAKLWESYEKVVDAWIVERDRRDAPLRLDMKFLDVERKCHAIDDERQCAFNLRSTGRTCHLCLLGNLRCERAE